MLQEESERADSDEEYEMVVYPEGAGADEEELPSFQSELEGRNDVGEPDMVGSDSEPEMEDLVVEPVAVQFLSFEMNYFKPHAYTPQHTLILITSGFDVGRRHIQQTVTRCNPEKFVFRPSNSWL